MHHKLLLSAALLAAAIFLTTPVWAGQEWRCNGLDGTTPLVDLLYDLQAGTATIAPVDTSIGQPLPANVRISGFAVLFTGPGIGAVSVNEHSGAFFVLHDGIAEQAGWCRR
jgi:hypothetical protein